MTQREISKIHTQHNNRKPNVQHTTPMNGTQLDRKQKNEQHLESSTPFTCLYEFKSKSIVGINHDYRSKNHAQETNNTVDLANCSHCFHTVDFACCHHFGSMTTYIKTRKDLNQKPYHFKKLKFHIIRTEITNKPKYQLSSWHRTETVPKPYRKRKKRTIRYVFKNQKNQ
ncbi:hypothetical protein JT359_17925 [Candidatus Poribacteria bacterium]|nr:hypothetical protein [Candidatus Poribacteria bacterium]